MSDQTLATADRSPTPDPAAPRPQVAPAQPFAAPQADGRLAAAVRLLPGGGADDGPSPPRFAPAQRHHTLLALQRTAGNAAVQRLVQGRHAGAPREHHGHAWWLPFASHEASAVAPTASIQRVTLGTNGSFSAQRAAIVRAAAAIAEQLVMSPGFANQWDAFWARSDLQSIRPRPTLAQYRQAVRSRVVHDMDSSHDPQVRMEVLHGTQGAGEQATAAITRRNSVNTFIRRFAVDQGIDTVVNLLLHESLHGAGLPEGPSPVFPIFEPWFHQFEANVGFPSTVGGANIVALRQHARAGHGIDVAIIYTLRRVQGQPVPPRVELRIVRQENGSAVASQPVPARAGRGQWTWHVEQPDTTPYSVRLIDLSTEGLMGSRPLVLQPKITTAPTRPPLPSGQ
jgi:hypothetical protein